MRRAMTTHLRIVPDREGAVDAAREPRRSGEAAPILYIVDDDVATLELLREIAIDAGWEARAFTRLGPLRSALGMETPPTLLVLDDDLPDGRGGDLAREVRQDPRLSEMTLIVCTAAHAARQAEITRWAPVVSKPFDLAQIEHYLEAAVGGGTTDSYDRAG
jgi:DNA-binding response OmpR family regulator